MVLEKVKDDRDGEGRRAFFFRVFFCVGGCWWLVRERSFKGFDGGWWIGFFVEKKEVGGF